MIFDKIKKILLEVLYELLKIFFFLFKIPIYFKLWFIRTKYRRLAPKLTNKNKNILIKSVKSFFKTNKNFEIEFVVFYSRCFYDKLHNKHVVKLSSKSILKLVHEVCHIVYGDTDKHEYNLKFALKLAKDYIYIFEPRAIKKEIEYAKKSLKI